MNTLETLGKWAVIIGAAGYIGEKFIPQLKSYGNMIKYLIIGGGAAFVIGYFL